MPVTEEQLKDFHNAIIKNEIEKVRDIIAQNKDIVNQAIKDGSTPLHIVAWHGYTEIVKVLIASGAKVNEANEYGATPLHLACEAGSIEVVKALIASGADINKAGYEGTTPLYIACENDHTDIVKLLIKKGVDINKEVSYRFYYKLTILHCACSNGHTEIVKLLLKNGADINKADVCGETPLHSACRLGHTEIVKLLLKKGITKLLLRKSADINKANNAGETPLFIACHEGYAETVKLLLDSGADINKADNGGRNPLLIACGGSTISSDELGLLNELEEIMDAEGKKEETDADINEDNKDDKTVLENGRIRTVELLLEKGADINQANQDGETPLYVACQKGYKETVKLLLEKGADINQANQDGETPLYVACQKGYKETVKLLLEKGADINQANKDGETPLYVACQKGYKETVKLLLEKGADINQANQDGETPLYVACQKGYKETVKLLLEKGADINQANKDGETPLYVACQKGYKETVELLLEKGADINQANKDGETPLYVACQKGYKETVELLLEKGADINQANKDGETPLYVACKNGRIRTVELLLKSGADINKANKDNNTPLEIARKNILINKIIEKFLLEKKADIDKDLETALYHACKNGQTEKVKLLLKEGADINKARKLESLCIACLFGHTETVKLLLEKGADINKAGEGGKTPISIVQERLRNNQGNKEDNKAILALLKKSLQQRQVQQQYNITKSNITSHPSDNYQEPARITQELRSKPESLDIEEENYITIDQLPHTLTTEYDKIRIATEISYIFSNPLLSQYYQSLTKELSMAFNMVAMSNSGEFQLTENSFLEKGAPAIKDLASSIPIIGGIVNAIGEATIKIAEFAIETDTTNKHKRIESALTTQIGIYEDQDHKFKLAEEIARMTTLALRDSLELVVNDFEERIETEQSNPTFYQIFKKFLLESKTKLTGLVENPLDTPLRLYAFQDAKKITEMLGSSNYAERLQELKSADINTNPNPITEFPTTHSLIAPSTDNTKLSHDLTYLLLTTNSLKQQQQERSQDQLTYKKCYLEQQEILDAIANSSQNPSIKSKISFERNGTMLLEKLVSPRPIDSEGCIIDPSEIILERQEIDRPTSQKPICEIEALSKQHEQLQKQFKELKQQQEKERIQQEQRQEKREKEMEDIKRQLEELKQQQEKEGIQQEQRQEEREKEMEDIKIQLEELKQKQEKNREDILRIIREIIDLPSLKQKLKKLGQIADFAPNIEITIGEGSQAKKVKLVDIMGSSENQVKFIEKNIGNVLSQISAKFEEQNERIDSIEGRPSSISRRVRGSRKCLPIANCSVM